MKIKNLSNQKKEIFFMICAALLTILLIIYLFVIVKNLVDTSREVYGTVELPENAIIKFDFEKYKKVISKVNPTSTLKLPAVTPPPPASSASSTASSTVSSSSTPGYRR